MQFIIVFSVEIQTNKKTKFNRQRVTKVDNLIYIIGGLKGSPLKNELVYRASATY